MKNNLTDIAARLCHETDRAYLVWDGRTEIKKGDEVPSEIKIWLPKSMVEFDGENTFTMPIWLAHDKGFI